MKPIEWINNLIDVVVDFTRRRNKRQAMAWWILCIVGVWLVWVLPHGIWTPFGISWFAWCGFGFYTTAWYNHSR